MTEQSQEITPARFNKTFRQAIISAHQQLPLRDKRRIDRVVDLLSGSVNQLGSVSALEVAAKVIILFTTGNVPKLEGSKKAGLQRVRDLGLHRRINHLP